MKNNHPAVQQTRKDADRCNCPTCMGCADTARVCFNSRKLALNSTGNGLARAVGLLLLLAGFVSSGQATAGVISPGGHTLFSQNDQASPGYLKVFSTTQQSQWGEGSYYYPHTGYRIYNSAGQVVKWVDNHHSSIDENPETIELAPGTYTVWAQSDKDGYVKMPVVIKLGRITAVHLES